MNIDDKKNDTCHICDLSKLAIILHGYVDVNWETIRQNLSPAALRGHRNVNFDSIRLSCGVFQIVPYTVNL